VVDISRERWLLLALVTVGAALRFGTLGVQSFDIDESVTVALLHQGLHGTLNTLPTTEKAPPLYYVLAWLWSRPFGLSEAGLRSFSALAGTLTVPLAYDAGKQLISKRVGLIAAALVATSPFLIWYSQEARAYALLGLLAAASFVLFVRVLSRPTGRVVAAWALVSVLALATHYFAVFLVAPEALWLLVRSRPRSHALVATGAIAAIGAALVPLAIHQANEFHGKEGFLATPLHTRVTQVPVQFLLGPEATSGSKPLLVVVGVGAVVASLLLLTRADRQTLSAAGLALSVGAIALVVPVALALAGIDFLDPRNLAATWLPLIIVPAAGFAVGGRVGLVALSALLATFVVAVIAVNTDQALQRTDYRGLASALGASPGPGERTIVVSPGFNWTALAHYLPKYPQLSSGNVGVREVDLVGWKTQALSSEARLILSQHGFRLAEALTVQKLRLVRFLAPDTRSISSTDLRRSRLGDSSVTVLIQAAR